MNTRDALYFLSGQLIPFLSLQGIVNYTFFKKSSCCFNYKQTIFNLNKIYYVCPPVHEPHLKYLQGMNYINLLKESGRYLLKSQAISNLLLYF